jgi:hypothetical protein
MAGIVQKKQLPSAGQKTVRAVAKWMPFAFIAVVFVLLSFGIADIRVLAANSSSEATLTAAELKDKIDELRWILELILAASGLFTIAQGIAAGFSARSFADEAKGILAEANARFAGFTQDTNAILAEARQRFTTFSLLEERRKEANANLPNLDKALSQISPAHSLGGRFYGNLPMKLRQELLSAERIFPYEVVGHDDQPDEFARNLRRLAQFYSAKFSYERERGSGSLGDLEHAQYLLSLAIRKTGSSFYLLNDLGNVHIVYYRVLNSLPGSGSNSRRAELQDTLNRARSCFEDSITAQPRQLRAYYNLAVIEADLAPARANGEGLRLAIGQLRKGLKYREWEQTTNKEFTCNALYNLACYYARLSAHSGFAKKAAVAVLRKAAKYGRIYPEYVNADFNTEKGDFYALTKTAPPETIQILNRIQHELSRHNRLTEQP